jgi:alpha-methylacyl-CoA racemase
MMLAFGMACGLLEAQRTGKGQVVDCAMVDGAALLMAPFHAMLAAGHMSEERGTNLLDTGSHFYDAYECADGKYISIGSIEPQFYAELLRCTGLSEDPEFAGQMDRTKWRSLKKRLREVIRQKTQAEWCDIMEGTDVCFAPVLPISEAYVHPHNVHRKTFVEQDGVRQPAPAPRFSRTVPEIAGPPSFPGEHTADVLAGWLGCSSGDVAKLREAGAVR